MIAQIELKGVSYKVDLSNPLDISIPLRASKDNVRAWYVEPPKFEPVKSGNWIGEVAQGGSVNFRNIFFNPHGHGTHTECVGHITKEFVSLNKCMKQFFFPAKLISVAPEKKENGDLVIKKNQIIENVKDDFTEAIIIRTLPNDDSKLSRQYSHTNPAYLDHETAKWMCETGIKHLLLDLPSVDREEDGGKLLAHHAFWNYPAATRFDCTITEMIYVLDSIADGNYFLNIQIASFENDASPSKPVLFTISKSV
ncbi:MAG: cyclase family protein [Bacteroidia bacterium]